MSEDTQTRIVELMDKLYDEGIEEIDYTWYGGEPLLCDSIVRSLSKRLIALAERKKQFPQRNMLKCKKI